MNRLNVIVASTRPGRVGKPVGDWFHAFARRDETFDVQYVDLAEVDLPLLDEPHHPRQQNYQHEHTKQWARSVDNADAYVFVVPEYNHGPTPALINALNYVYREWNYKPASFVSYGGISGGMRSVESTIPTLVTLKMMPLIEQVTIPLVTQYLEDGCFKATEQHEKSATAMIGELNRWADALKALRG